MNQLELPNGRIAYHLSGPSGAPLVVLVHGMGLNAESFRHLIPLVTAAGYRVAALDIRGHGSSSAAWPEYGPRSVGEDVVALIRELGGPAIVMGNSSGAAAVIWVAGAHPELVSGLVIESGFFTDAPIPWYLAPIMAFVTHVPSAWKAYYGSLFRTRKPDDYAQYAAEMIRLLKRPGRMAALRGAAGTKSEALALLPRITAPTLVVVGSKDPDFADPVAEGTRFVEALRDQSEVKLSVIDGAGHYPHAEFAAETARSILDFAKRTRG